MTLAPSAWRNFWRFSSVIRLVFIPARFNDSRTTSSHLGSGNFFAYSVRSSTFVSSFDSSSIDFKRWYSCSATSSTVQVMLDARFKFYVLLGDCTLKLNYDVFGFHLGSRSTNPSPKRLYSPFFAYSVVSSSRV
jgi:hypothetical protein